MGRFHLSCAPATAAASPLTTSVAASSSATAAAATVIASVLSATATASVSAAVLAVLLFPSDVDYVVRYSEVFDLCIPTAISERQSKSRKKKTYVVSLDVNLW